jgi:hypothetical protein
MLFRPSGRIGFWVSPEEKVFQSSKIASKSAWRETTW